MKTGDLGTRMKMYEAVEAQRRLMMHLPIMARLDGKAFHTFTQGMKRPYDRRMSDLMVDTTKYLVEETGALMGYCQSDEITLTWNGSTQWSEAYFGGRQQKLCSILAAMATAFFNDNKQWYLGHSAKGEDLPELPRRVFESYGLFDCRVWNVPNHQEGTNCFVWREADATKNSIAMAAQSFFSHKQLMNKSSSEMQEMMFQVGQNWNDYPDFFKRGTYVQRRRTERAFTCEELAHLPAKHNAHKNPDLKVSRSDVMIVPMPQITKITNRIEVIYEGAEPVLLPMDWSWK
jgi:tRNA(His) 5'-end guanylyltransferase